LATRDEDLQTALGAAACPLATSPPELGESLVTGHFYDGTGITIGVVGNSWTFCKYVVILQWIALNMLGVLNE
jgi:hypothetical protein